MFQYNYQFSEKKETYFLIFLFLFSFAIRIPAIFIFGDTIMSNENEWGVIVGNLAEHGKFSLRNFEDFFVPNLYMPPLYPFYLYFFKLFNFNNEMYVQIILFSQNLLSSISIIIFYFINKFFFSNKISILGTLIFSLFPLHIYACTQISSAILQTFLTIIFFYFFFKTVKKNNFFNICFLSLASGLLMLLRGEFVILFTLSILYLVLFFKISLKNTLAIILLTMIVISPYLIRNIVLLENVTIVKAFGYNLWKGNNPVANVEGKAYSGPILNEKIRKVPKDKFYDINLDNVFLNEGIKNIKDDPIKYLKLYIKKFFSFIFIDINSSHSGYYHPLHYLPVLLIGVTSIIGIVLHKGNSYQINFLILFFFTNVAVVSVFFILARYKLSILPLQIIFSNIFFEYIKNNFFKTS